MVEDELNVDHLEYGRELADVLTFELVPNFRVVGPRLGEAVKELKPALAALDSRGGGQRHRRGKVNQRRAVHGRVSNSVPTTLSCG